MVRSLELRKKFHKEVLGSRYYCLPSLRSKGVCWKQPFCRILFFTYEPTLDLKVRNWNSYCRNCWIIWYGLCRSFQSGRKMGHIHRRSTLSASCFQTILRYPLARQTIRCLENHWSTRSWVNGRRLREVTQMVQRKCCDISQRTQIRNLLSPTIKALLGENWWWHRRLK